MTRCKNYEAEIKKRIDYECDFIQVSLSDIRELKDVNDVTRKKAYSLLSNVMDSVVFLNHCFRFL